jgi:manganese/zinc/iron transport system substrate-binding protein
MMLGDAINLLVDYRGGAWRQRLMIALIVATLGGLWGCHPTSPPGPTRPDLTGRKAVVVATTTLAADLVRHVGGVHVEVLSLMPPNVDPHQYKASAGDVRKLQGADLIVFHGLHLEGRMADLLSDLKKRLRVVELGAAIPESELLRPRDSSPSTFDPHIWFDVKLWSRTVDAVRDALIDLDPAHAEDYTTQAASYRQELESLHAEVRETIRVIPSEKRVLITAHDAFHYFGRAYGFEVRGLQGVSTVSEPGLADVQELARFIAERRIPAIFAETSVPDRNLLAVQQAVQRTHGFQVRFCSEKLYSDSLGEPGTEAGTYVGMIRANVRTIVSALATP